MSISPSTSKYRFSYLDILAFSISGVAYTLALSERFAVICWTVAFTVITWTPEHTFLAAVCETGEMGVADVQPLVKVHLSPLIPGCF